MNNPLNVAFMTSVVWVLLLTSLRFTAQGAHGLYPVIAAGWNYVRCPCKTRIACKQTFLNVLDLAYMKFLSCVTSMSSVIWLYAGFTIIGIGLTIGAGNNVLRFISTPADGGYITPVISFVSMPLIVLGLSAIMAAVSPKRKLSLALSGVFIACGAGIGAAKAALG